MVVFWSSHIHVCWHFKLPFSFHQCYLRLFSDQNYKQCFSVNTSIHELLHWMLFGLLSLMIDDTYMCISELVLFFAIYVWFFFDFLCSIVNCRTFTKVLSGYHANSSVVKHPRRQSANEWNLLSSCDTDVVWTQKYFHLLTMQTACANSMLIGSNFLEYNFWNCKTNYACFKCNVLYLKI